MTKLGKSRAAGSWSKYARYISGYSAGGIIPDISVYAYGSEEVLVGTVRTREQVNNKAVRVATDSDRKRSCLFAPSSSRIGSSMTA